MQMRQRNVAALDAKYTKELADAKAKNDALRDDVAAGRRRLHIKAVRWVSAWSHHRLRRIMQLSPRLADTAERDYLHPQRGWSLCKNNWKEPRSILMSRYRVAHIDGQLA